MKGLRTRGAGGARPDSRPPESQNHKHAENFFDKKRERSRPAVKNKPAFASVRDSIPALTLKTRAAVERGDKKGHYRPIAKEIRHDGFTFRQIAREGDVAIYEQKWKGCANPSVAYEVVRIRRREAREIKGKIIEAAEVYPRAEAWGIDGFTLTDKDEAFAKLREPV
jgi:hypothetical protein